MDELFGDVFDRGLRPRRRGGFVPAVDVYYVGDPPRAVVRADLAGIDPAELELEIRGRELILGGQRARAGGRPGAPLPAARDRARAVPPRRGARRRRRRRRRAGRLRGRHARGRAPDRRARRPAHGADRAGAPRVTIDIETLGDGARTVEMGAPSLPDLLPVLPLRDTVTFPDTLTPLAVGQERSIQLVNDVLGARPPARDGRQQGPGGGGARAGPALPRRRRRHRRAHAQGARRHAADPRPGRPAGEHRGVGLGGRPTSSPASPRRRTSSRRAPS